MAPARIPGRTAPTYAAVVPTVATELLQAERAQQRCVQGTMTEADGFLLVDKPSHITSRRVVDAAERLFPGKKVGHCGTLDPLAEGLLVIAVGKACRLTEIVHDHPKSYLATFQLGVTSDTDDVTAPLRPSGDPSRISEMQLREAIRRLTGELDQVPPVYSAHRVAGRRAYRLARAGKKVELKPKRVTVYRFELLRWQSPEADVFIECSRGTYIRSLARDLGRLLGCGAVMKSLRRTAIGPFHLEEAIRYAELVDADRPPELKPMGLAVGHLPRVALPDELLRKLTHGQRITWPVAELSELTRVAVFDRAGSLVAIAWYEPSGAELRPRLVLRSGFSD